MEPPLLSLPTLLLLLLLRLLLLLLIVTKGRAWSSKAHHLLQTSFPHTQHSARNFM